MIRRAVLLVVDGLGVGALPDADMYGDLGSNTLGNLARAAGGLDIPQLGALGLTHCTVVVNSPLVPARELAGAWGIMAPLSPGKETMIGHWELAGVVIDRPLDTFPHGFPAWLVREVEGILGRPVLGNVPASGTEIIARLGEEHLRSGRPILYTSADSVLQVAAHEEVVPPDQLYDWCARIRELLDSSPLRVGRVIARPFTGQHGSFRRTPGRHDWALPPPGPTVLDALAAAGCAVIGIGKVPDIYAGRGITTRVPAGGNPQILAALEGSFSQLERGLIVANLVDFDMLYGHRNDVRGYAAALATLDAWLGGFLPRLGDGDMMVITADHGCDPTTPSTDHSRELVPVLVAGPGWKERGCLGVRHTLADVAATLASRFGLSWSPPAGARPF
ncbi:MAG: phosphopentomutase [Firmicutes bacterium]|nr:phosphopentomutase [Bacillota bacterium]